MMYFVITTKQIASCAKIQILPDSQYSLNYLSYLNRSRIHRLSSKFSSDRYYKRFKTYHHLVTMLYAIYHKCTSIREVTTGMQACAYRLHHLGIDYSPRRSTLSDANRDRPSEVFEAIYRDLYHRYRKSLPDSQNKNRWFSKLYLIDSTTISLFKEILKNAGRPPMNGKYKGGIKVHTMMKAEEDVPCLVKMTAAAKHDAPFIKGLQLPKGSIVAFDKGYIDYRQYQLWTEQGIKWVTRLRQGGQFEILTQRNVLESEKKKGVLQDTLIILGHQTHSQGKRIPARLVVYYDKTSNKEFRFITNNLNLNPSVIALIYKHRWQIEILFKRIKQNFPLRYFLGDNENAIRIQIWCALIADLILKIIQRSIKKNWSFGNLSSMVRIHLMSYVNLTKFLENPDKLLIHRSQIMNRGPSLFG